MKESSNLELRETILGQVGYDEVARISWPGTPKCPTTVPTLATIHFGSENIRTPQCRFITGKNHDPLLHSMAYG